MIQEGSLATENVFESARKYLSEKTIHQMDLNTNHKSLIIEKDGKQALCLYLGKRVKKSEVDSGIQEVSSHLNRLADEDSIKGTLTGMVTFDLSPETSGYGKEPECFVLSYIFVHQDIYDREMKISKLEAL